MFRRAPNVPATPCPPLIEIEHAVVELRRVGALCYVRAWGTNQGLSMEVSFNTADVSTPSGGLEVCLREATINIASPQAAPDWTWNEGFLEIAEHQTSTMEQSFGSSESEGTVSARDFGSKLTGKGKVTIPIASAELGSEIHDTRRTESKADRGRSRDTKLSRVVRHIEVQRPPGGFRIGFSAHPLDDLVALNTSLARLPVLDVGQPSALDFTKLTMDLRLRLDPDGAEVRHAFHIRNATGAWRPLVGSLHKRLLAELLISKFLRPLHDDHRLWPQPGAGS